MGEWKRFLVTAVTVILLIANENGWFRVPEAALTLITSVYLGSSALVGVAKNYAAGQLLQGSSATSEQQQKVVDKL